MRAIDRVVSLKDPAEDTSKSLSVSAAGQTYDAMLTIPSDPIEGYADFTIALGHDQKATLTVTEDTFNQSVFVDTIRPRIELVGSANYTVFIESNDPFIPGATATDGDPGYSPNYTVTTNGTLDTSKLSTVVVYTYTADDDTAGNPGMSINRTVSVIDFEQIDIKSLTLTDNNHASSDYVKAGDTVTLTLITDGSDVGNATGHIFGDTDLVSSISGNRITFTKTVYENDTNGLATFEIFVRNSTGYAGIVTRASLTSGDVTVDTIPPLITLNGENNTIVVLNYAYTEENATAFDASYGIVDIFPTGTVHVDTAGNYTLTYSAQSDLVGNPAQDITRNVRVIDFPPLSFESDLDVSSAGSFKLTTLSIARNHVNTFQIDTATYAGVSTSNGLYIMNITNIRSISNVSTVSHTSITGNAGITYTDFVLIDGSTYALSGHLSGVLITDVTNPASPSYVAHATDGQDGFTTIAGARSIATTTIDSSTYALVVSNNDNGVQIIDITNPYNPTPVWSVSDGSGNFTTLSGARSIAITTIDSSTYALVASSIDDGVQIIDITTPSAPIAVKSITDGQGDFTTLDNARHISITTIGSSTYALVASYNDDGVQIIDITNPSAPIAALSIKDSSGGYNELSGASYIAITTVGSSTYALVASYNDAGVDATSAYVDEPTVVMAI